MKSLRISEDLDLPLDGERGSPGAVTQKNAFLGRTGSGKTYAATKLAELLLEAKAQIVALDPVGVWPFLRLGERPFEIPVLGGLYGDVPLESTGGALVADFVVDTGASAVLDVSQFTGTEQRRFATAFAERFFQRQKAKPAPIHLFLEECQEFVPQESRGEVATMLGAFERLVKLGRNFGIGVSLISQRPQEVNKKALNQTECLFAFQMTGPQERKAIAAWTHDKGLDVDIDAILPKLAVGSCYVWSPQWLGVSKQIRIAKKRTADGSATPKAGMSRLGSEMRLAPVNLPELRERMAETVERAKADDPKALRAEIAKLKAELAKKPPVTVLEPERVEVPVIPQRVKDLVNESRQSAIQLVAKLAALTDAAVDGVGIPRAPAPAPRSAPIPRAVHASVSFKNPGGDPGVGKGGLRRILIALAQRPTGLTNRQIGIRAGLSSQSGTFSNYLSRARQSGWVADEGEKRRITQAGLDALGSFDALPEGAELLAHWLGELGQSGASRMLQALADAYPETLTNEEIGKAAGVSHESGTFSNYMSRLRGLELITGGRGSTRMSEELADG
jgi:hypothetical protein